MTEDAAPAPIVIGGTPVHETLEKHLSEMVQIIVARHRTDIEDYRRLPLEVMRGDVTSINRDAVRMYVGWLRDGSSPQQAQLAHLGHSAARRAEEGLPLPAILIAYIDGFQDIFRKLVERATPEDLAAVLALADRIFEFLRGTTGAVAVGYLEELQATVGQEHSSRRALLDTLLRDGPSRESARMVGVNVASRYLMLNLAIGPHPDELQKDVNPVVVARRMIRRVLGVLTAATDDQALVSLEATGGIVLMPAPSGVDWSTVAKLVRSASRAAGAPIRAAAEITTPAAIPDTAIRTGDMLDVLRWFDRPPGLYRLDDVLVEYQLTRPGEARVRLAAVLEPLRPHPELLDTLLCYVNNDLNRRRAANQLHIHPNTVDYRLRRITELTGVDAGQPGGIQRLTAALAAQRAENWPGDRDSMHS